MSADLPVGENLQDHLTTTLGPFMLDTPVGFNPLSLLSPYTHLQVGIIVQSYCLVSLCLSINHCNDWFKVLPSTLLEDWDPSQRLVLMPWLFSTRDPMNGVNQNRVTLILKRKKTRGRLLMTVLTTSSCSCPPGCLAITGPLSGRPLVWMAPRPGKVDLHIQETAQKHQ